MIYLRKMLEQIYPLRQGNETKNKYIVNQMSLPCLNPPTASSCPWNTNKTSLPQPSRSHMTHHPNLPPDFSHSMLPFTHCVPHMPAFFLKHIKHIPPSGSLYLRRLLPGESTSFPGTIRLSGRMYTIQGQPEQRIL